MAFGIWAAAPRSFWDVYEGLPAVRSVFSRPSSGHYWSWSSRCRHWTRGGSVTAAKVGLLAFGRGESWDVKRKAGVGVTPSLTALGGKVRRAVVPRKVPRPEYRLGMEQGPHGACSRRAGPAWLIRTPLVGWNPSCRWGPQSVKRLSALAFWPPARTCRQVRPVAGAIARNLLGSARRQQNHSFGVGEGVSR